MSENEQTQTTETPPVSTPSTPPPQEHNWEQRYKDTQSALTRTKNELEQVRGSQQQLPVFEGWNDASQMFNLQDNRFTDNFRQYLDQVGMPEQVRSEFESTFFKAREINQSNFQSKFDKVAGFDNALTHITGYLNETYEGADLQRRLNALQSDDYYEYEAQRTLAEMKEKNWQGGAQESNEPSPLPDTSTTTMGVAPLDPLSDECSDLMMDPKYKTDPAFRENVAKRIAVFSKAQNR